MCSAEHIDAFTHLDIALKMLSCWTWKSSFAPIPEEQSLLPHYCGIGDLPTVAAANCYCCLSRVASFISILVMLDQSV